MARNDEGFASYLDRFVYERRAARAHETFRSEELLIDAIAGLIAGAHHAAIGASSPIPAAAALLARERGHGRPYVSLLGSRRHSFFTDGRELFDCAGQGRIDVFFLSGGQIDGEANINLVGTGEYAMRRPERAFPVDSAPPTSITSCPR